MTKQRPFMDKAFKNKNGKITLWQTPNWPLIIWALFEVLSGIFTKGKSHEFVSTIAFGAIFTWGWLEISNGVNYFRRVLGTLVIILSVLSQVK